MDTYLNDKILTLAASKYYWEVATLFHPLFNQKFCSMSYNKDTILYETLMKNNSVKWRIYIFRHQSKVGLFEFWRRARGHYVTPNAYTLGTIHKWRHPKGGGRGYL